jgi:hypothetical protein
MRIKTNWASFSRRNLKLISSTCSSLWLTTYLLCLVDMFFNRQSVYLWVQTVLLFSGQGMKQTYLYLWYPLSLVQWDRCDQRNHQTYNYLVKGHHLYSGTWNCHHIESFTVVTMTWLTVMEYLCHKWPRICSIHRMPSRSFPRSWLINGFVARLTWRVPPVEQELMHQLLKWVLKMNLRRDRRYQRGNKNPQIEEGQTTQWPKRK